MNKKGPFATPVPRQIIKTNKLWKLSGCERKVPYCMKSVKTENNLLRTKCTRFSVFRPSMAVSRDGLRKSCACLRLCCAGPHSPPLPWHPYPDPSPAHGILLSHD